MPILKEKFQPILMKVDTPAINRYIKELQESADYCNVLIEDVEKLLSFDLTQEQKIQVLKGGKRAVLEIIKVHYGLEGSNDQMALNRTNLTINQMNQTFGEYHSFGQSSIQKLDFEKDKFIVKSSAIEEIKRRYTYTTKN